MVLHGCFRRYCRTRNAAMADAPEKSMQPELASRSPWPAIALVFWVLWLLAMACMSRNEWKKPRSAPREIRTAAPQSQEIPR
jgi:hypothetical protein